MVGCVPRLPTARSSAVLRLRQRWCRDVTVRRLVSRARRRRGNERGGTTRARRCSDKVRPFDLILIQALIEMMIILCRFADIPSPEPQSSGLPVGAQSSAVLPRRCSYKHT